METGVDIVKINRFEKMENLDLFLKKYFSTSEQEYVGQSKTKFETIAGLYASKEAILKAFGIGIGNGINLKECHIVFNDLGKPVVELNDLIIAYLKQNNCKEIKISISHDGEYAVAFCVIN